MDIWSIATVLLWMVIFMIGLFPETIFSLLRELGYVVTQRALINSPWLITFLCAVFLGGFCFCRCVECKDAMDVAFGKSVQVTILALAAFLPLHIEQIPLYLRIPIPYYRNLIMLIIACKTLTWLYLLSLLLRYHLVSGHEAFKTMPLFFPSALRSQKNGVEPVSENNRTRDEQGDRE